MNQSSGLNGQSGWNSSGSDAGNAGGGEVQDSSQQTQAQKLLEHEQRKRRYLEKFGRDKKQGMKIDEGRGTQDKTQAQNQFQTKSQSPSTPKVPDHTLNVVPSGGDNHTGYLTPKDPIKPVELAESRVGENKEGLSLKGQKSTSELQLQEEAKIEAQKFQPYFLKDNFCLYQGDSLEIMKRMPSDYVDMIFADPPYFLSEPDEARQPTNFPVKDLRDKGGNYDNYKGEWDVSRGFKQNLSFHYAWIKEARRILKPEGTIWITGTHHSIYQCGTSIQALGFKILNEISWYKANSKYYPKKYFNFSHETIIWARKSYSKQHMHYFNKHLMDKWIGDPLKDTNQDNPKSMRTVWQINPPSKKETIHGRHPTQKPLQLLQRIILASTRPDSIILDPFNGSGTTGVAIQTLNKGLQRNGRLNDPMDGRKYIGIDREVEYLELTKRRVWGK